MYRSIGVALMLLPASAAFPAHNPPPHRNASVKLWLDTSSSNPCEHANPAGGGWTIRNNEDRNVLVTVHRATTLSGVTTEDDVRDTLGPRESRDLGCEFSQEGRQAMRLVKAIY